jgi:hypothetical protein
MGEVLTLASLPPSKPGRWVARLYDLTEDELLSWMRAYSRRGLAGLKIKAMRRQEP